MRIQLLSDLHLEFASFEVPDLGADVVILAGDIGSARGWLPFALSLATRQPVVFVPGNHEYYGGAIPHLTDAWRQATKATDVHVLDGASVTIDGVRFLGATLWTDFELHGPERYDAALFQAQHGLNDFRRIRVSPEFRQLHARDTAVFHRRARQWVETELEGEHSPTVVVTHHAPSLRSIQPKYQTSLLSAAFASPLDALVAASGATVWCHGHTHYAVDYQVGGTRVLCNPRGYPGEPTGFDPNLVFEVG